MHPSFENLAIISAPSLQASLMDIQHDTSFMFILKGDSISSTSKAHICSYWGKGVGQWLIIRPSIHSFCITHFIFTSMLHFCSNFIQPSTFSLFTFECEHGLNASSTHLTCCPFGGQQIATHDAIRNVIYAFIQKSEHDVWKELWSTFMLKVSLRTNFYMTCED